MPKASPLVRSFNAGEFSDLLFGRVDLDRYPASVRSMYNYIAAPQGPAIGRSGTAFVVPVANREEYSALIPFVFSNEQAKMLEFSSDRIRFLDEDGVQVYDSTPLVVTSLADAPIQFTSAALSADIGDDVALSGFPVEYNLNGEIARITAKSGDDYTLDVDYPNAAVVDGTVARVYSVPCVYTEQQRKELRFVQSVDVTYLLTSTRTRKLSRFSDYDWRLEDVEFVDGPYLPVNTTSTFLTPSATGNVVPSMTSNVAPSGDCKGSSNRPAISGTNASPVEFLGRNITYTLAPSQFFYAFDDDDETYWAANTAQEGIIEYEPDTPFVCDGYTIYAAKDNQDTSYTANDFAPSTWSFEGFDGTDWVVIDRQEDYVLYDGGKSVFFELDNETSYQSYRLNIQKVTRNGPIEPRCRRLVLRERSAASFDLSANAVTNINDDRGFLSSDVGRLIRLKGSDTAWRSCEITAVASATQITVELLGEPLLDVSSVRQWRLGYWSDTTGWPATGDFFEDRLWLAGSDEYPDLFAGSVTGAYETFSQTDTFGTVLDDSAIVGRLNSRRLSRIRWLSSDSRGLLMGTGSEEYTLSAPSNEALTARNVKARPATRRGSANVEPVRIDNQLLYLQRSGRTLREFAFVFEADGYKSPSMSQLASHLGAEQFVEMDYAAEPHSLVWVRRANGSLVGLTYNRDENVVGWHRHDLSGGKIETLAVIPQKDQLQDALWCVVSREVDGLTQRYVERLTVFFDFDTSLEEAHFVDSALRYEGAPTTTVYGMQHLEGMEVYGLADTKPVGPFVVMNGQITLPFEASNIILGLGFDAQCEVPRLENGAADGTAQGKVKRINSLVLAVWRSFGGQIGVYNKEVDDFVFEPIEYPGRFDEFEDIELYTGVLEPIQPEAGYDMDGVIAFRRPKETPLPFNVVFIAPQLHTQDR